LRLKYAARSWSAAEVITEADRVERVHGFNRTSYGFPKGIGRGRAVVETDTELSKIRGKKCNTALIYSAVFEGGDVGIVINANRRLAGRVCAARARRCGISLIARRDSGRWWRRCGNVLKRDGADETLAQRIPRIDHDAISSGDGGYDDGRRFAAGRVTGY